MNALYRLAIWRRDSSLSSADGDQVFLGNFLFLIYFTRLMLRM